MKKALTLVVLIVTPTLAFAQGTVQFNNLQGTGPVRQWTSWSDSNLVNVPKTTGTTVNGRVEILTYYNSSTAFLTPLFSPGGGVLPLYTSLSAYLAANPGWVASATVPISSLQSGVFNTGVLTLGSSDPGANVSYAIVGWTGSYATWDLAYAANLANSYASFMGISPVFTTPSGNPLSTPPGVASSISSTFIGLTLAPAPGCLGPYFVGVSPPTSQTVVRGATATFYVAATACPQPYYQWYFNGVSIAGATGSNFQISNAQLANAGTYSVVLSNTAWGAYWGVVHDGGSATLTVLTKPIITSPPQSQTAEAGSTVNFRASATGSPPLAYQWFFNGGAISGAGSASLQLTNLQSSQSGTYTVVVTNIAGAVTSAPAMFSVIPPVERRLVPGLSLLGQPGSFLNLEEVNALDPSPAWVTFDSVRLTNTSQWYFDVSTPLPPQRFYRAWQTGGPGIIPALSLYMVPAITLTGSVGSTVRVDYINQLGPIDAWVALDSVTLTDTSPLYFDVSALRQSPRLYHLVPVP